MANGNLIVQTDPNLERRRQLAMEMMQAGQSGAPVQAWTQGANRILQSLLGAYNLRQAEQEQAQQQQLGQETLQQALSQFKQQPEPMMAGGEGGVPFDLGQPTGSPQERFAQVLAEGPYTSQFGTQMMLQQQQAQQQAQAAEAQRRADIEAQKELARFKADQESTSQFQGTGVEQQMLNILLDPNIPDTDPRKQLARQRLSRPTTTVTPSGTYIQPGYDVNALMGGQQDQQIPTGFTPKPATGEEQKTKGYYDRMVNASDELNKLGDYNPVSTTEAITGLTNITASPEKQRYKQAASDWIRAKLRRESGAVIGDEEMASEYVTYFPVYGDSPEVLEQKARARQQAEQAMLTATGQPATAQPQQQLEGRRSGRSDLRRSPEPALVNEKGWRLHTDAQGNRAYVGPNGEIQEI